MVKRIVAILLITKFGIYLIGFMTFVVFNNRVSSLEDFFVKQWNHWDSTHYLHIANHGYVTEGDERFNIVFLPLYPFLISLVSKLGIHPVISGIIVSYLASIFLAIYLFKLTKLDFNEEIAEKSVFYLFPDVYGFCFMG